MALEALHSLPMPADYFQLALRRFGGSPAVRRRLLEGTGIDDAGGAAGASPPRAIQLGQQLTQVRNLNRHGPEGWGLELGSALRDAAHGDLAVAASCSDDLATALDTLVEFGHVRAPYFELAVEADATWHRVIIRDLLGDEAELRPPLIETLLLSIQALVESALGQPMTEARFLVGYAPPPYADRYRDSFHASVRFDAPETEVHLPVAWLQLACPFADAARHASAVERLAAFRRTLASPTYLVAEVERALEASPRALPSQQEVARSLGLSRRTLTRWLGEHDVSFRDLVGRVRKRRAEALLADSTLTIAEIADQLGYGDAANFGRAVRRWVGCSPRAFRERLQRKGPR